MHPITGLTQNCLPIFENAPETNSELSMSSSVVSPVRTYHKPEMVPVLKAQLLVYGGNSPGLLARFDPAGSCWKMLQRSLLPDVVAQKLLRRLPPWGMTRSGALYRLPMPERRTCVNAGSVWPTATATDSEHRNLPPGENIHVTQSGTLKLDTGALSHVHLSQTVQYYTTKTDWHTPIANDALKQGAIEQKRENGLSAQVQWFTPNARDSKGVLSANTTYKALPNQVQAEKSPQQSGQLNPAWVEMLMGFPPGWTELD